MPKDTAEPIVAVTPSLSATASLNTTPFPDRRIAVVDTARTMGAEPRASAFVMSFCPCCAGFGEYADQDDEQYVTCRACGGTGRRNLRTL